MQSTSARSPCSSSPAMTSRARVLAMRIASSRVGPYFETPGISGTSAIQRPSSSRSNSSGLSQHGQEAAFHVDHVIATALGGPTEIDNLALACVSCSLCMGARRAAVDPVTGEQTPLFSPRSDPWRDHFRFDGVRLEALTAIGRTTIAALRLNRPLILAIRSEEAARGRHPRRASEVRRGAPGHHWPPPGSGVASSIRPAWTDRSRRVFLSAVTRSAGAAWIRGADW